MKAYYLSLFFLCLTLGFAILDQTNIFETNVDYDQGAIANIRGQYDSVPDYSKPLDDKVEFQTEDPDLLDRAIGIWTVVRNTIFPNFLLEKTLGLPRSIAILVALPIQMIYLIGIAQLFGALKGGKSAI